MAALVSVDRASLTVGTQVLLDGVSLGLLDGDRIGVVGRNGGGKSTLLRVLHGSQAPDSGRVVRGGSVTVGLLSQADDLTPTATVRDVVVGDRADHEWAGQARIRGVLEGLLGGVDAPNLGGMDATVGSMSGGEQRRQRPGSALVVVTHDRWFLDAVATQTWEVGGGAVHQYDGGYAAYVLARAERDRVAAVTEERRANLVRKELAWLRRGPPARTSKPRFRIDAANALIEGEPPPRDEVELVRFATTRLGKDVLDLLDATVRLGDRVILDRVTWRVGPGDRFGVVGVNGAGKSTLLRVLQGEVMLETGKLKTGQTVRTAYLSQDLAELAAVEGRTVIDAITEVRSHTVIGRKEVSASQLATRLGFSGGRQQSRVSDLSGGERRRLQFLRLLMDEPNVLLLDEPTNDLDIDTLTSMEDVLDGWAGTLLVVSHDRYLLERMTDRQVALLGDGTLRDLPGGVEEYLRLRARPAATIARTGGGASAGTAPSSTPSGVPDAAAVRAARKTLARVERALARLAEREDQLHARMAEHATDAVAMTELAGQLEQLHGEESTLEQEWLEAAEVVEGLS